MRDLGGLAPMTSQEQAVDCTFAAEAVCKRLRREPDISFSSADEPPARLV